MAGLGKMDIRELEKFRDELMKLQDQEEFLEACIKELAARLYAMVVKATPVGDYGLYVEVTAKRDSKNHKKGDVYEKRVNVSGKTGGTLRRGWTIGAITKEGNTFKVEIINPVEYASYVEYGHRQQVGRYVPALGKKLKQGWVPGRLMMTNSKEELERMTPQILEKKIRTYFERCMK